LEEIRNASLEELAEIPELNEKVAQEILEYFRKL
ncbi:MAG: excinuclease ABC subunit UvrC, partial [Lachnospiraceae bacterium]|nr:excinuclease ABC subunit UvrC [Lachnospiraceae bacterium]